MAMCVEFPEDVCVVKEVVNKFALRSLHTMKSTESTDDECLSQIEEFASSSDDSCSIYSDDSGDASEGEYCSFDGDADDDFDGKHPDPEEQDMLRAVRQWEYQAMLDRKAAMRQKDADEVAIWTTSLIVAVLAIFVAALVGLSWIVGPALVAVASMTVLATGMVAFWGKHMLTFGGCKAELNEMLGRAAEETEQRKSSVEFADDEDTEKDDSLKLVFIVLAVFAFFFAGLLGFSWILEPVMKAFLGLAAPVATVAAIMDEKVDMD